MRRCINKCGQMISDDDDGGAWLVLVQNFFFLTGYIIPRGKSQCLASELSTLNCTTKDKH